MQETQVPSLGWEDPLEKAMATPVFLPGDFQGQSSLRATVHGVTRIRLTEQLTLSKAKQLGNYFRHNKRLSIE